MDSENQMVTDLWGNQRYAQPRQKGRPPFEWTQENSNKVSMMTACGWSNDRIAGCVLDPRTGKSISVPTLKRHFRAELNVRLVARDQLVLKQMMAISEKAFAGDVSANKHLTQLIKENDLMRAAKQLRERPKAEPAEQLGKKEMARRDAVAKVNGTDEGKWGNDLNPGYYEN